MEAMAELFRKQVTEIALAAYKITIYRDMNTHQQLECFIAGALTGLVGVCLASIQTGGSESIIDYLAECLPYAHEMAESIKDTEGSTLKNHHDAAKP
jgi:hypothetical protein